MRPCAFVGSHLHTLRGGRDVCLCVSCALPLLSVHTNTQAWPQAGALSGRTLWCAHMRGEGGALSWLPAPRSGPPGVRRPCPSPGGRRAPLLRRPDERAVRQGGCPERQSSLLTGSNRTTAPRRWWRAAGWSSLATPLFMRGCLCHAAMLRHAGPNLACARHRRPLVRCRRLAAASCPHSVTHTAEAPSLAPHASRRTTTSLRWARSTCAAT